MVFDPMPARLAPACAVLADGAWQVLAGRNWDTARAYLVSAGGAQLGTIATLTDRHGCILLAELLTDGTAFRGATRAAIGARDPGGYSLIQLAAHGTCAQPSPTPSG